VVAFVRTLAVDQPGRAARSNPAAGSNRAVALIAAQEVALAA